MHPRNPIPIPNPELKPAPLPSQLMPVRICRHFYPLRLFLRQLGQIRAGFRFPMPSEAPGCKGDEDDGEQGGGGYNPRYSAY